MGSPVIAKIGLWTEGLNENWGLDINNRRRIDRGRLNILDLRLIVKRVRKRNRRGADCLLILEGGGRYLEIHVNEHDLLLSNPQDPNYQNVTIQDKDLREYVERYFTLAVEVVQFEWTPNLIMQCITLGLVLTGFGIALVFALKFFAQEAGFIAKPSVFRVTDPIDEANAIEEFSGIYATGMWDGGMVIELKIDGTFHYYDLKRSGHQLFILEPVQSGRFEPVYKMNKMALLTDLNYLFYPQEGKIIFQDRTYELVAQNRKGLPNVAFPD